MIRRVGESPAHALGIRMDDPYMDNLHSPDLSSARPHALKLALLLGAGASPILLEEQVLEVVAALAPNTWEVSGPAPAWLRRAEDYLNEEFSLPSTLKDVGDAAGVHPVHLAKTFKRYKGCTVGTYIRRLRLAKALLSGASLGEAAVQAGFYDQNHMCRVAKRELGSTPLQFREALRNI